MSSSPAPPADSPFPDTPAETRAQWAGSDPGLDTSPMEVIGLLKRAAALLARTLEPLYAGAPLTAPEADMLIPLRHTTEPVIARRIAEQMGLSRAAVSKTLAKLEGRGFISRTPNPADRRAALVTITPAGARAVDAYFPRQLAVEADLLTGLDEDRAHVVTALARLVEVMETRAGRG